MTAPDRSDLPVRFERDLRAFLESEAGLGRPDYLADILLESATLRQRRAWTLLERWLPMDIVTTRVGTAPRIPWRALVVLGLIVLSIAASLLIAGAERRLAPPFGPARNGVIAYTLDGDILTADPVTGARQAIVAGQADDSEPRFSRDGSRIAFVRQIGDAFALVVADADGRHEAVVTSEPFADIDPDGIVWSPDGRSIALSATPADGGPGFNELFIVDAVDGGARRGPEEYSSIEAYWRPPDGRQLLFRAIGGTGLGLFLYTPADGTLERVPTAGGNGSTWVRPLGWTPDGRRLAYQIDSGASETRILDLETGAETVLPVSVGHLSNDGRRVVGLLHDARLCVVAIEGGPCDLVGDPGHLPTGHTNTAIAWSPDDQWILTTADDGTSWLIDAASGTERPAPWQARSTASWQRR